MEGTDRGRAFFLGVDFDGSERERRELAPAIGHLRDFALDQMVIGLAPADDAAGCAFDKDFGGCSLFPGRESICFRIAPVSRPIRKLVPMRPSQFWPNDATDPSRQAGEKALHERNVRRVGLAISLFVGITVLGLWLTIRSIAGRR
jgi:hypothetical protein